MKSEIINTLQELVVNVCDSLYANRQLITKSSVQKKVQMHGLWTDEELDAEIPLYINEWRLHNLQEDKANSVDGRRLKETEEKLARAIVTIRQLNAELTTLRLTIAENLRGLLHG